MLTSYRSGEIIHEIIYVKRIECCLACSKCYVSARITSCFSTRISTLTKNNSHTLNVKLVERLGLGICGLPCKSF